MTCIFNKLSKPELQNLLDSCDSYVDVLRTVGMTKSGTNNKTLKKKIELHNLDLTKLEENRKLSRHKRKTLIFSDVRKSLKLY